MNTPTESLARPAFHTRQQLREQIVDLRTGDLPAFEALALAIFRYQAAFNPVYRAFLSHLPVVPEAVQSLDAIPFLPISFFKNHTVATNAAGDETRPDGHVAETVLFESSGTTGAVTSRHRVADPALYDTISQQIFEEQYGPIDRFHILALLPSYLERNNSSLVYMVQRFIEKTSSESSGFFLHNTDDLTARLRHLAAHPDGRPILLIGVTFGLLDWADSGTDLTFLRQLPDLVVMETGGMKGRRRELLREEVHERLSQQLGIPAIHSEYGMTELLSQAYSTGNGVFQMSATMRILLRDVNDPFQIYIPGHARPGHARPGHARPGFTGGINVIDLANLDSCSFIETQDLGQYDAKSTNHFKVIGRFDNSDIRGCNLMAF